MEATEQKTGTSVRWLVVGAYSATPAGRRFQLSTNDLAAALEAAKVSARATVTDRLGADATRAFDVTFPTFKSFQASDVVASVSPLRELQALAAGLAHTDPTKRPAPDEAIARVVALVGDGKLAAALRPKLGVAKPAAPAASPASPAAPAAGGATMSVDDLLDATAPTAPHAPTASSAIGSFLKAVREPSAPATAPSAGRAARDLIEGEIFLTAVDILKEPGVAALESAWRGVKMLVDASPANAGMGIEVVDVAPDGAIDAARGALADVELDDLPDAVFVSDPCDDVEGLSAWANFGADYDIPVLASVTHRFFRVADAGAVAAKLDDEDGGLPDAWKALRNDDASRWLSVVTNRVVLRLEGTGTVKRPVFGSPVLALAAMIAQSYNRTGAFAQVVGESVSMPAPGSWELPTGRDAGMLVPTENFLSASAQTALWRLGIIGFGSRRNSGNLVLKGVPTVRAGEDVIPLPAQMLTGRIVRFARWVLAQLPPNCPEPDVKNLFEQAAAVFLFPAAQEAARLEAQVVAAKDGGARSVVLQVSAAPILAGIMFHLGFSLPLPD
jgi:type VI secretion system protein ImpC